MTMLLDGDFDDVPSSKASRTAALDPDRIGASLPAARRRGRPPGSKNKPKAHQRIRFATTAGTANLHRDVDIPWRCIAPFLDGEKRGNNGIVGKSGVVMTALWPGVWTMDYARRRRAIATRV